MRPSRPSQPFWLLAPMLLLLAVFFVYPLLSALHSSFYEWDLLTPPRFAGLANYRAIGLHKGLKPVDMCLGQRPAVAREQHPVLVVDQFGSRQIRDRVREIPLARAMALTVAGYDGATLALAAPLAPNGNDKGCAFGGSLASLMTLAGWAWSTSRSRLAGTRPTGTASRRVAVTTISSIPSFACEAPSAGRLLPARHIAINARARCQTLRQLVWCGDARCEDSCRSASPSPAGSWVRGGGTSRRAAVCCASRA